MDLFRFCFTFDFSRNFASVVISVIPVIVAASTLLILFQPGDELVSVDGTLVAGFSFSRVRSAVVGAMGSVVELQVTVLFCQAFFSIPLAQQHS